MPGTHSEPAWLPRMPLALVALLPTLMILSSGCTTSSPSEPPEGVSGTFSIIAVDPRDGGVVTLKDGNCNPGLFTYLLPRSFTGQMLAEPGRIRRNPASGSGDALAQRLNNRFSLMRPAQEPRSVDDARVCDFPR